jgi:hypothetical protein
MLVVVLLALGCAFVADPRAQFEHLGQNLVIGPGPPQSEVRGRVAHVGAIQANPDTFAHIVGLGHAGVGTAEAHLRTIHGVVDGIPERLVDVALHLRVKRDHLADGHSILLLWTM